MTRPPDLADDGNPLDDLDGRRRWLDTGPALPRFAAAVTGPGMAAIAAGPGRAPRRAADLADAPAGTRHNWRPIGPRNLGGRVRALAPHPDDADRWYAGPASGGVHVTTDGGHGWHPVWHAQPSLAIGAIAVARSGGPPRRVYVATGEPVPNGFAVAGHGIWISDDDGQTWSTRGVGDPEAHHPGHRQGFDAITVHPSDHDHCWAVGGDGVFRTRDGGLTWDHFRVAERWTDAVFADGTLYLVRGRSRAGECVVVRLDDPATATDATLEDPTNQSTVIAAGAPRHAPWPARAKIAIAPSEPAVAYVRVADERGNHMGLFRATDAAPPTAPPTIAWSRLPDHDDWLSDDDQGTYCLSIAVHPTEPGHVVTGAVHLYASRSARGPVGSVEWYRAMHWSLHDEGRREHHADNHTLVVATDGALWVANDGGIARSTDWDAADAVQVGRELPLAEHAVRWDKRDLGITAAQMYDIDQSPLVPGMIAAGLQDNGTHVTVGGPTWRAVFGADGAFPVFDPDDPSRLLVTYYGGILAVDHAGLTDETFPDEDAAIPVRGTRVLEHGFLDLDGPAFVPDTARHSRDTARVLHTREDRLYGTSSATGETFELEMVGSGVELVVERDAERLVVVVAPTRGALRLGLAPGTYEARTVHDPVTRGPDRPARVRIPGRLPGPFGLEVGDVVRLDVDGTTETVTFAAADAADLAAATVGEVCARLDGSLGAHVRSLPRLWPSPRGSIELVTHTTGTARTITLGGTALDVLPDGLSRLEVGAGTYRGAAGRPASVTLSLAAREPRQRDLVGNFAGAPARRLTVAVDGGPTRTITFEPPAFPDPADVADGHLVAALRAGLADDAVHVIASPFDKAVALESPPTHHVVATGTAAARLGIAGPGGESLVCRPLDLQRLHRDPDTRGIGTYDLDPGPDPSLELTLSDGSTTTAALRFTASDVARLGAVTPEELHTLLEAHLAVTPAIEVEARMLTRIRTTQASELRFSRTRPDEAWVGGEDGRIHVTHDDGETWTPVAGGITADGGDGPTLRLADLGRPVEAIALHPTQPDTAWVGLHGRPCGPRDPGFLFRTTDGGESFTQVGATRGVPPTGVVGNDQPLPVHATEVDPDAPERVFVATTGGVFRSGDGGDTWSAFNENLPNCPVTDLTFEPTTRTLTAAAWGRGAWQRHVGDQPPTDVRVFVRATELDRGTRPAAIGPGVLVEDQGPMPVTSPDIKLSRTRPATVVADPLVDGVVFDLDVPVDPAVADQDATAWVQIHNGGAFAARSAASGDDLVRVILLRARAGSGPPRLPDDVWSDIGNQPSLAGSLGEWTVVLDRRLASDVVGGRPVVVSESFTVPADAADAPMGLLAIVVATDDAVARTATDVAQLLASDRQVAYREVPVVSQPADRRLLLRTTGPASFRVDEPAGPGSLAARLDIADADRGTDTRSLLAGQHGSPTYDLSLADDLAIQSDPVPVSIDLGAATAHFVDVAAATPIEVARLLDAELERAGVPAGAYPAPAGLRLRTYGGARVRVTGGDLAARLGVPTRSRADARAVEDAVGFSFDLDLTGDLDLEVVAQGDHAVTVRSRPDLYPDARFASPRDVALVINRALRDADLLGLVRCEVLHGVGLYTDGDALLDLAGAAVGNLSLARVGTFAWFRGNPGVVDATTVGDLVITVTPRVEIDPRAWPWLVPSPATTTPPQIRRLLDQAMRVGELTVRTAVPRLRLRVGRSTPDASAGSPVTGGAHLAELLRSSDPVAPVDDAVAAALFTVPEALREDVLEIGVDNELFLRIVNDGPVEATDAEYQLVAADTTAHDADAADAITLTALDNGTVTVPAEGSAIVHVTHRPGAGADDRFVLVVVDPAGAARAVPATVATIEELLALARAEGAALRHFRTETP